VGEDTTTLEFRKSYIRRRNLEYLEILNYTELWHSGIQFWGQCECKMTESSLPVHHLIASSSPLCRSGQLLGCCFDTMLPAGHCQRLNIHVQICYV